MEAQTAVQLRAAPPDEPGGAGLVAFGVVECLLDHQLLANLAVRYSGPERSSLTIRTIAGRKWIQAGSIKGPLATRKNADGTVSVVSIAPGFIGFDGVVAKDAQNRRTLTMRDSQHVYVYTEVR